MSSIVVGIAFIIACIFLSATARVWPNLLKKYWRIFQLSRQFPGPRAFPLIGNANLFFRLQPWQELKTLLELLHRYGDTMKLWFGPNFYVFLSAPQDVEVVLGGNFLLEKAEEYDSLRAWLNEGLLISAGQKWHSRRKLLTPAFHFRILEEFVEIFERQSRVFVECLHADAKSGCRDWVDMGHRINLLTLDIICESAMGVPVNAQTKQVSEYVVAVKLISTVLYKRFTGILYRFDWLYKLTHLARAEKKALAILHGFTERIIDQRRAELLKSHESGRDGIRVEKEDIGVKRKLNFLDILLQSQIDGKSLSNLDVREEVDTFMFEGHDTVSAAMTFLFYNIARYPECQRKCFEEIVTIFGADYSKPVTIEQLNKLHYIELCIKETLRLFPSVPMFGRKAAEDCEINGKIIPAGATVAIPALHIGRLAKYFPEPDLFKPERFDVVTRADKMNIYSYIPFSAGPRNCIGQKFAILEIKCVVMNVLRHFVVEYAGVAGEEPLLTVPIVLNTRDPIRFKLKPRLI